MSSMYEEAVADATKLREEAKKYGMDMLMEQIAPKINEAISSILEQDPFDDDEEKEGSEPELENDLQDDFLEDPAVSTEDSLASELVDDLPLAANEGKKLCDCPEEDEEIEIDFDQLRKHEKNSEGLFENEELKETENHIDESEDLEDDPIEESKAEDTEEKEGPEDELNEIDLSELEESIVELSEELEIDFEDMPATGWSGVPESDKDHGEDVAIASKMDGKRKEDHKEKNKALKSLEEKINKINEEKILLEKKNSIYNNEIKQLKKTVGSLKLISTRLLYQNKVFMNESLNGVQKKKFVLSLEKAKTTEAAKLIFETTLQSTVGSQRRQPKSRSEVTRISPQNIVAKPLREGKQRTSVLNEHEENKMRKLAGLSKGEN